MSEMLSEPANLPEKKPSAALTFDRYDKYQRAMYMRFNGAKYREIAQVCRVSDGRVRCWFMRGGMLEERYRLYCKDRLELSGELNTKPVADRIKDAAPLAIDSMVELMKGAKREQVRFQASADILDRAGYSPILKQANVHAVDEMSIAELDKMMLDLALKVEARISKDSGAIR